MLSLRLALRALAWRGATSAMVFAVALVGIAAAAVGPIYLHAVGEAVLAHRLTDAPQRERDLRIQQTTTPGNTGIEWHAAVFQLATDVTDRRRFDPPVFSEQAQVEWAGVTRYHTELAAIDDLCANVTVVSGQCPRESSLTDTVVTQRTAQQQHITVGQVLKPRASTDVVVPLHVVGIVRPMRPAGSFWTPWDYLNAGPSYSDTVLPRLDAFFVSHHLLDAHQHDLLQTVSANLRLRVENIRLDDIDPLRAEIRRVQDAAARPTAAGFQSHPTVGSGLASVLDAMRSELTIARTLVILPTAQLVLLALVILYAVVSATAAAAGHEAALAKLRGRRTRSLVSQGLAQPVLMAVVAAPVAAALAWIVVKLSAPHLLGAAVDVTFPVSAIEVVVAATAASVVAAAVAARRIVTTPVGQLLRRSNADAGSVLGLALVDSATVALALAAVVELAATGALASGRTNPLAAVAAVLLGGALAVVLIRLLPVLGRAAVRATSDSPRLAAFLAVRQIVRRPLGARVIVLVAVALALASFAMITWSSAAANREQRGLQQAGADTAYVVRPDAHVSDLRTAVDKADPGGHSLAAAVVQVDRSTPLLAVDSARLDGIAAWAPGNSSNDLTTVARELAPRTRPSITVRDSVLRLSVDAVKLPPIGTVDLSIIVTGVDHIGVSYDVGRVTTGRHTFVTSIDTLCHAPCRITQLALIDTTTKQLPDNTEIDATIAASSAASPHAHTWRPVDGFADPVRWRQVGDGGMQLADAGSALAVRVAPASPEGPWPTAVTRDTPDHLPAVIATDTAGTYEGPAIHDVTSFGLDARALPLDGVDTAISLPVIDRTGVMIDFGAALTAARAGISAETRLEVLATSAAPPDLPARLARQGVTVVRTIHASTLVDRLDHSGPAFADGLFLVAAITAMLLAIGAAVLAGLTTSRRRAYELAALEVVGVRPRTLRRSAALEQGVLLVIGLVAGVSAGMIGAQLALPSTPVFVDQTIGPPVDATLPYGLIALLAAVLLIALVLTSALIARIVSHQATAGRLREAQA